MRSITNALLGAAILAASTLGAHADIKVVASIKPVHSLVAGVMKGVGEPQLIIDGAGSPHTYAMKPSQAVMLEQADAVFWVGHELEAFLEKPLETLGSKAKSVELVDAKGLIKLELREGGAFEGHDHHDDEGHHDHNDKKAGHDEKAGHEKSAEADNAHRDAFDPHVWLDPVNAKAFVRRIRTVLSEVDPKNAAVYERNATALIGLLDELFTEVNAQLEPVRGQGFIVFHDAYQYFEKRFGLNASGSITVSPEVMPGAKRVSEMREKVQTQGVSCVYAEPQFQPKLVSTVTEGTTARSGVLDPLGASLGNGPNLYFGLIRNMAASFKSCLSNSG